MENKFRIILIAVLFITIISFSILNEGLGLVKDIASSENRKMAEKPNFDLKHLDSYPAKYEKYYNDNFSIRAILVRYFNIFNIKCLKKSPVPDQVIIGDDDWLFLGGNWLDSYKGKNRLKESELDEFRKELDFRKKYLNERNCKFYFLIAPEKASIYPEKVPSNIFQYNKQSWGEQLLEYLEQKSEVKPINVFHVLRTLKVKEQIYYKLDNHWNQLGAFYSANEVLKRIHKDFSEVSTNQLSEYSIVKSTTNTGNLVGMLSGIGDFNDISFQLTPKDGFLAKNAPLVNYPIVKGFPYPTEYENEKEIKNSKKPRLLIISDSFGGNIFPFLSEQFSRSIKIFDSWQYKLNEDIVESENPNIVLLIVLESNIRSMLANQSRLTLKNKKQN